MNLEVIIVATCTNRKTALPASSLTLRNVRAKSTVSRAHEWIKRLQRASASTKRAENVYAGDHWQVVRSIPLQSLAEVTKISIWVASAGYGLIPITAEILPYSATFSSGYDDSVQRTGSTSEVSQSRRLWWSTLSEWPGPSEENPRTLESLVSVRKNRFLMIAGSLPYLDAMADDLSRAAALLPSNRVAIFCAGADSHPDFERFLVPCDARLQATLGGALNSLNARCMRRAIQSAKTAGDLELPSIRKRFASLVRRQPPLRHYDRRPLTDDEVRQFIESVLKQDPAIRPTPMLRVLRDSGRACQQSRFQALFHQVEGGNRG